MASYWIDSKNGSDSTGSGTEGSPWQHLSKALAAITAPLTEDTYIYLKDPGDGTLYTGDVEVQGISALGGDYQLIIQPAPTLWDQDKYEAGEEDPLGGSGGFDPRGATFPVKLQLVMELFDCSVIELRGLWFYATSSIASAVKLMKRADLTACYCRFEGLGSGALGMFDCAFDSENCYYTGCNNAVMALYDSKVHMAGNNYLLNPVTSGIHVGANSQLVVRATPDYPEHNTLSIETTKPRIENFAALKAAAGSTILVQDEKAIPLGYGSILTGYVEIHHNLAKLRKGQVAVALNGCSKLIGVDQVTCTMLDVKSETVDMPKANQFTTDDSDTLGTD